MSQLKLTHILFEAIVLCVRPLLLPGDGELVPDAAGAERHAAHPLPGAERECQAVRAR